MSNTSTLEKGIKKLLIFLGLLIASPLVLSIAFKAIRIFKEAPKVFFAYGLLVIGVLLTLFTVYFGFKTFKTLLDYLFEKK
ncbi:DUF6095 family protein [uncultured Tenacibaculum sp.]|uniref:DUF6095 family protein n=1 Tax=uncultured Tenacibaculum sp. TaxID=174713 RepID=UPI00261A634A|nr:DUF6095 family protein [uncultured Tenacibaculum sp.]